MIFSHDVTSTLVRIRIKESYLFPLYKGVCQLVAETSNCERKKEERKSDDWSVLFLL